MDNNKYEDLMKIVICHSNTQSQIQRGIQMPIFIFFICLIKYAYYLYTVKNTRNENNGKVESKQKS